MTNANDPINYGLVGFNGEGEPVGQNPDVWLQRYGLTKREFFATNAPEVPEWFIHKQMPEPKKPAKSWVDMEDGEDKDILKSWQHDPCFDLPEHLQWYQEAWEKYQSELADWKVKDQVSRYFQWRTFYADQLIEELNKEYKELTKVVLLQLLELVTEIQQSIDDYGDRMHTRTDFEDRLRAAIQTNNLKQVL